MGKNEESVRDFFDDHAPEYKSKYERKNRFYEYFFYERLEKATQGIDFSGKRILDIGAGTGPLYDFLASKGIADFESYDATDLSSGMLEKSNIPPENRKVGEFLDLEIEGRYDLIFMLGVSTYLEPVSMKEHVAKISKSLAPDGMFIVTFTNRKSLDIQIRNLLSPIIRLFAGKNRIIAQSFETWFYSRRKAQEILATEFEIINVKGLNHTFFPFSRVLPGISILLAKKLSLLRENGLKFWLSSDLIFLTRKD